MSIVGKWKLSEASGNRVDDSGNGYNLTPSGTLTQVAGAKGTANTAVSIQSGYLSRAGTTVANLIGLQSFSIRFRIRARAAASSAWGNIGGKFGSYVFALQSNGAILATIWGNGASIQPTTTVLLTDTNWHEFVIVSNNGAVSLYIDNTACGTGNYNAPIASNSSYPFIIGESQWNEDVPANVETDDWIIYNHALSTSERADLYALGDEFAASSSSSSSSSAVSSSSSSSSVSSSSSSSSSLSSSSSVSSSSSSSSVSSSSSSSSSADSIGAIGGVLRDRQGNAIDCSIYSVRMNVYSLNNTSNSPILSALNVMANGAYLFESALLVPGTKYLLTFEYVGMYIPLGDPDISGADIRVAL